MATTWQSLRFVGPVASGPGGGSFDALNRILADLCTRGSPKVVIFYFSSSLSESNIRMRNWWFPYWR
ncbi:hypothetical protein SLA2020_310590 [Shorea laevis]